MGGGARELAGLLVVEGGGKGCLNCIYIYIYL